MKKQHYYILGGLALLALGVYAYRKHNAASPAKKPAVKGASVTASLAVNDGAIKPNAIK